MEWEWKMRRIISIILAMIISIQSSMMVGAIQEQGEVVYSNKWGLTLTQEEYDYILNYISEEDLIVYTEDEINYILSNPDKCMLDSQTTYVKTLYTEVDGKQEIVNEEYISEEELMDSLNVRNVSISGVSTFSLADRKDTVSTTMKSIEMNMTSVGASVKKVVLNCTWLSIPKCKSYDIVAFMPASSSVVIDTTVTSNIQGYQFYDDDQISYNYSDKNIKLTSKGIGLSTNIVDSVEDSLSVKLSVAFGSGASKYTVYGTYQHATDDVSLTRSQYYTFSKNGMGGVIDFYLWTASKYDDTPGLSVTGSIYDIN